MERSGGHYRDGRERAGPGVQGRALSEQGNPWVCGRGSKFFLPVGHNAARVFPTFCSGGRWVAKRLPPSISPSPPSRPPSLPLLSFASLPFRLSFTFLHPPFLYAVLFLYLLYSPLLSLAISILPFPSFVFPLLPFRYTCLLFLPFLPLSFHLFSF